MTQWIPKFGYKKELYKPLEEKENLLKYVKYHTHWVCMRIIMKLYIIARRNGCKYFPALACLLRCFASTKVNRISVRWTFRLVENGCSYCIYIYI